MTDVGEILCSWGLRELIPVFHENKITLEIFANLESESIKELIPAIGTRIMFNKNFDAYIKNKMIGHLLHIDDRQQEKLPDEKVFIKDEDINEEEEEVVHAEIILDKDIDTDHLLENVIRIAGTTASCDNSNLKELLLRSLRGRAVLSFYKLNKSLKDEHRDKLVEIIIEEELESDPNKRITNDRFELLATGITTVFPTEPKDVYFNKVKVIDRQAKKQRLKNIGRGKLFAKYYNLRKQLKGCGIIETNKSNDNFEESFETEKILEFGDELEWLKQNTEPYQKVEEYWRKTFKQRQNMLKNGDSHEYVTLFPVLNQNFGYNLFFIDYRMKYPKNDILSQNWSNFSKKVITYARANTKDKYAAELLEEISNGDLPADNVNIRVLKLLPYLLSPVTLRPKWKVSRTEMDEGFLMHIKNINQLQDKIEEKQSKRKRLQVTLQPTPIIVGDNLDTITASYVRINPILYKVESPLKAIEVSFKAFHALQVPYPQESEQVWLIVQKALFNLETPFDNQFTSASIILRSLTNLQ